MTEVFNQGFVEVSVPVLRRISGAIPFDVYIKRAEKKYTKLFPQGESVDLKRLDEYETQKGIKDFYVKKEDYRQYLFYVEKIANSMFQESQKASTREQIDIVKEMINLTMIEIVVNLNVDTQSVLIASRTVQACLNVILKSPKFFVKIFKMLSRHPYSMKHSVLTSFFSVMLGRSESLESEKSLEILGLGAMLHDIGMGQLEFDAEEKEELNPKEWKEVKEHPEIGARLMDSVKGINPQVRTIIMQHHEQPNGMGYPNKLREKEIYYLSKIVSIADSFAALISPRPFREEAFQPVKAIEIMTQDRGKFDFKLLEKFSKQFINTK